MTLKGSEYTQNYRICVKETKSNLFAELVRAPLFMELTIEQKIYDSPLSVQE